MTTGMKITRLFLCLFIYEGGAASFKDNSLKQPRFVFRVQPPTQFSLWQSYIRAAS
jgi:hypothetical protein